MLFLRYFCGCGKLVVRITASYCGDQRYTHFASVVGLHGEMSSPEFCRRSFAIVLSSITDCGVPSRICADNCSIYSRPEIGAGLRQRRRRNFDFISLQIVLLRRNTKNSLHKRCHRPERALHWSALFGRVTILRWRRRIISIKGLLRGLVSLIFYDDTAIYYRRALRMIEETSHRPEIHSHT